MAELKTLKDLDDYGMSVIDTFKNELKAEAVKWIKEDIEEYRQEYLGFEQINPEIVRIIHNFIVRRNQKWKDRFNLTEEDLK